MNNDDIRMKRTRQCYQDMKQRCYNPKAGQYKNYGARGIIVCDEWLVSIDAFLFDMGLCPNGLSIDRIDVNGNYEPGNCKWSDKFEQAKNKRTARNIEYNGMCMNIRDWASHLGIHETTINSRINRGYPLDMVLSSSIFRFGTIKATAAMQKGTTCPPQN